MVILGGKLASRAATSKNVGRRFSMCAITSMTSRFARKTRLLLASARKSVQDKMLALVVTTQCRCIHPTDARAD